MIHSSTILQLRYHAGLEGQADFSVRPLADLLWEGQPMDAAVDDVLRIFEALNLEANGNPPSADMSGEDCFPRALVYAIVEIVRLIRGAAQNAKSESDSKLLISATDRIELAWAAILAGDVDDLRAHIWYEEAAR